MILVDTSIWIDHFRKRDAALVSALEAGQVLSHPFVIGELALGGLRQRDEIIAAVSDLPHATVADDSETLALIERQQLSGIGIGYIDAHLLAATRLTRDAMLWTRDRKLHAAAIRLDIAAAIDD